MQDICVYYDEKKRYIIDITPRELDPEIRSRLEECWSQDILRDILILISEGVNRLPDVQKRIGHSSSTLHAAVKRLCDAGLLEFEMIYKGNKQKILSSRVLCASRSSSSRISLQRFFQGLWVDSEKTKKVIEAMQEDHERWWSADELSAKTKIPVEEIELLLSNFDSLTTRSLSQFLKGPPFEKRILYRAKEEERE